MRILYLIFVILLSTLFPIQANSQDKKVIDEDSNYVVIGAFNIYENAVSFVSKAKQQNFNADCAFNENKKLYYVFISKTSDHALAIEEAKKLQAQSPYPDTWVYGKPTVMAVVGIDVNPDTNKETTVTPSDKPANGTTAAPGVAPATFGGAAVTPSGKPSNGTVAAGVASATFGSSAITTSDKPAQSTTSAPVSTPTTFSSSTVPPPPAGARQNDETGKWYFFKVYSSVTGDSVSGNIDLINVETNKKSSSYKANENVMVKPTNKSGDILFACEILGYRPIKKTLNYNNPLVSAEVTQISEGQGQFILPFELVRLKKGDIAVMYDLYFYKDAAIIRSESRSEVGLLVDMMKENGKYKIRLHGHTNGGGSGKIITVGPDKNFFSLTGSKNAYGSAMKLSESRAEIVKEYLEAQGIDGSRIEVKAWGGKKPLYDVEHTLAQSNVRVEVEILED